MKKSTGRIIRIQGPGTVYTKRKFVEFVSKKKLHKRVLENNINGRLGYLIQLFYVPVPGSAIDKPHLIFNQ